MEQEINDIQKNKALQGAKKLTPLEMNALAVLKDHTVITFETASRSVQPK